MKQNLSAQKCFIMAARINDFLLTIIFGDSWFRIGLGRVQARLYPAAMAFSLHHVSIQLILI
jgi:hypothetical protein